MEECIFCKIARGEIPSNKIYEDEHVFAFLDIKPLTEGHTLVISKDHYEDLFDIPEEALKHVVLASKKVSGILKKKLKCDGVNLFNSNGKVAQQDIFHYHIHIIPRYSGSNFKFKGENISIKESVDKIFEKIKS